MLRKKTFFTFLVLLIAASRAPSQTPNSESVSKTKICAESRETLFACLRERSTQHQRNQATLAQSEAAVGAAGERINPVLNLQGLRTSGNDPAGDSLQASVLFTVDIHGLRSARQREAETARRESQLRTMLDDFDFLRTASLSLNRIRQIRRHLNLQKEIRASLNKSLATYKKRPRLSPDQEASQAILDLSLQDARTRESLLRQELHGYEHTLEIQIGETWIPSEKNLPPEKTNWVPVPPDARPSSESPSLLHAVVESEKAAASSDVALREKKPALLIGPAAEWTRLGRDEGIRAGLALQIPLPILDWHRGSRTLAEKTADRAQVEAASETREVAGQFDHDKEIYAGSVAALQELESGAAVERRLTRMEVLLQKGLVAGSAYSEALRQTLSLVQARDELEIKALDSWCRIQLLLNQPEACFL